MRADRAPGKDENVHVFSRCLVERTVGKERESLLRHHGLLRGGEGEDVVLDLDPDHQPMRALANGDAMLLGFNRSASDLAPALLTNKLPEGWHVALVDSVGLTIAASPDAGDSGDPFPFANAEKLGSSSGWTELRANGEEQLAIVQRSLLTGWTLVAWAPRALIAQPLSEAFWSLFVGGILLAATVVLAIYWVSLQIGRSVHGLENDAKLLGAGRPVPAKRSPPPFSMPLPGRWPISLPPAVRRAARSPRSCSTASTRSRFWCSAPKPIRPAAATPFWQNCAGRWPISPPT